MKKLLAFAVGLLAVGTLSAQNTTVANALSVQQGQRLLSSTNGTTSQFWYYIHTEANRSYCAETSPPSGFTIPGAIFFSTLTVYQVDTTTVIGTNSSAVFQEPKSHNNNRVCWVTVNPGNDNYIQLAANGTPAAIIEMRFTETTLFCPWFFVAGDYNAFSLIRNASNTSLAGVVVTWYGLNGAIAGTTTVTIPGNGTVILNARDFVNPLTVSNGSVVISHPGSPQQISGSTTTLSGTTGLGFDALFTQRAAW